MEARPLIDGAAFGPAALKVIWQAYDEAWAQIAANFGSDHLVLRTARVTLANAILAVASDTSRDVEALKNAGLRAMALNYRSLSLGKPKALN
jgi:hypothetical protein